MMDNEDWDGIERRTRVCPFHDHRDNTIAKLEETIHDQIAPADLSATIGG